MVSFSERVRRQAAAALKASGESRLGLSKKTGIPYATLTRSLDGHRPLNTDEIDKIRKALGIPLEAIVQETAA